MISWIPIAIFTRYIGKNSEIHGFHRTRLTRSNLAPGTYANCWSQLSHCTTILTCAEWSNWQMTCRGTRTTQHIFLIQGFLLGLPNWGSKFEDLDIGLKIWGYFEVEGSVSNKVWEFLEAEVNLKYSREILDHPQRSSNFKARVRLKISKSLEKSSKSLENVTQIAIQLSKK